MSLSNPLFEASYQRLFGDGIAIGEQAEAFFYDFYDRFLSKPGIAEQFAGVDLERQVSMLRKSLYQLVSCYLFDEPSVDLRRLAQVHQRIGVSRDMFNLWLESLIETVAVHDPEFDQPISLAWCWALSPGITYMKLAIGEPRLDVE